MPFEERFDLLCERAQTDYDEYLREVARTDRAIAMAAGAVRDTGAEDTRGLDDDLDR